MPHLVFSSKPSYQQECEKLFKHSFPLLDRKRAKAFRNYLSSPFLVRESYLAVFFEQLYGMYDAGGHYIQGEPLLEKMFGHTDAEKAQKRMGKCFKLIERHILRFLGYQYLREQPMEEHRLSALALLDKGYASAYQEVLKKWNKAIQKASWDLDRQIHEWLHAHYTYYSADVPKLKHAGKLFERVMHGMQQLCTLIESMYDCEKMTLRRGQEEAFSPNKASSDNELPRLYQVVQELTDKKDLDAAQFELWLQLMEQHHVKISPRHRFILWQLTQNYVGRQHRRTGQGHRQELKKLLDYQIDHDVFEFVQPLPREQFLGSITTAAILGSTGEARALMEQLHARLPEAEQELTVAHARMAICFHEHDHLEVIQLFTDNFQRHNMEKEHDAPRIKSYRLRSSMALVPQYWTHQDEYNNAVGDFEQFLKRQREAEAPTLSDSDQQFYERFLTHAKQVYTKLIEPRGFEEPLRQEIKQQIASTENMHAQSWLLRFVDTLSKRGGRPRQPAPK